MKKDLKDCHLIMETQADTINSGSTKQITSLLIQLGIHILWFATMLSSSNTQIQLMNMSAKDIIFPSMETLLETINSGIMVSTTTINHPNWDLGTQLMNLNWFAQTMLKENMAMLINVWDTPKETVEDQLSTVILPDKINSGFIHLNRKSKPLNGTSELLTFAVILSVGHLTQMGFKNLLV